MFGVSIVAGVLCAVVSRSALELLADEGDNHIGAAADPSRSRPKEPPGRGYAGRLPDATPR
jgi:hypothetical protein